MISGHITLRWTWYVLADAQDAEQFCRKGPGYQVVHRVVRPTQISISHLKG